MKEGEVLERQPAVVIAVSGNIAATKSTFVGQAESERYREYFLELVRYYSDIPQLVKSYTEPFHRDLLGMSKRNQRHHLAFQLDMLVGSVRLDGLIAQEGGVCLIDRSIDEHRYVFGEVYREEMGEDFGLYDAAYQRLSQDIPSPHVRIWLRAGIDNLRERIRRRGRPEEQWLLENPPEGKSHLQKIDDAFQDYMAKVEEPVIEINTDDIVLAEGGTIDHGFYERTFPAIAKEIRERGIVEKVVGR